MTSVNFLSYENTLSNYVFKLKKSSFSDQVLVSNQLF